MAPKPQNHNPMNLKNILSRFPIPEYPSKSRISNNMKDSLSKNGKDKVASLFHGLLGHIFSRILSRPWLISSLYGQIGRGLPIGHSNHLNNHQKYH